MKLWIILIKFMFIGALFLVSNYNLHLGVPEEYETFKELYTAWIVQVYSQGETLAGYVVKSEWIPSADIE